MALLTFLHPKKLQWTRHTVKDGWPLYPPKNGMFQRKKIPWEGLQEDQSMFLEVC
jgi:hypothetical protein